MKVRRRHVELGVLAHLRDFAQHRLAIALAEPGIDDEGGAAADDDSNVGHESDVAIGNGVGVRGELDGDVGGGAEQRSVAGCRRIAVSSGRPVAETVKAPVRIQTYFWRAPDPLGILA